MSRLPFDLSELKSARDVVRLHLEGILPSDILFISATVHRLQNLVRVTNEAPIVVHNDQHELLTVLKEQGVDAVSHSDARKPELMVREGAQYNLITGDTIPVIKATQNSRSNVFVPMLQRDYGAKALCVPRGFASGPDVRLEEFIEETGLCLFNKEKGRVRILDPMLKRFSDGKTVRAYDLPEQMTILDRNISAVWAEKYPDTELCRITKMPEPGIVLSLPDQRHISFMFNTIADVIQVPGELVPHWELQPDKDSERNIVGMHGYALWNIEMGPGDELVMVDPERFGRNGIMMRLDEDYGWTQGDTLQGALGTFPNNGFLPWAGTLQDADTRQHLLKLANRPM